MGRALQALSACAVLYVIVGVCGYLAFRERCAVRMSKNFLGSGCSHIPSSVVFCVVTAPRMHTFAERLGMCCETLGAAASAACGPCTSGCSN